MGLFAQKDETGMILRVIVADSQTWCEQRLGGSWVETGGTTAEIQGAGPGLYDSVAPRRFIPVWSQPQGAHDAISKGEWRWHNGRAWRNLADANVFEPGVSGWREVLTEWPEYVQPTGAHDAYQAGERISENGNHYACKMDGTVWPPSVLPQGWELQP
jgi:hypothetical protein